MKGSKEGRLWEARSLNFPSELGMRRGRMWLENGAGLPCTAVLQNLQPVQPAGPSHRQMSPSDILLTLGMASDPSNPQFPSSLEKPSSCCSPPTVLPRLQDLALRSPPLLLASSPRLLYATLLSPVSEQGQQHWSRNPD